MCVHHNAPSVVVTLAMCVLVFSLDHHTLELAVKCAGIIPFPNRCYSMIGQSPLCDGMHCYYLAGHYWQNLVESKAHTIFAIFDETASYKEYEMEILSKRKLS